MAQIVKKCYIEQSNNERATMQTTVKQKSPTRELYDVEEYKVKMNAMISNLRTKKPGIAAGMVGKNEMLAMYKKEIQKLVDDGYTVKQIAEAMKTDVFSILPKSITQILAAKAAKKSIKPVAVKNVKAATVPTTVSKKSDESSPTFAIKKDGNL